MEPSLCSSQDGPKVADSTDARRVGPEKVIHLKPDNKNLGAQGVQRRDPDFDRRQMVWDLPMIRNRLILGALSLGLLSRVKRRRLGVFVEL